MFAARQAERREGDRFMRDLSEKKWDEEKTRTVTTYGSKKSTGDGKTTSEGSARRKERELGKKTERANDQKERSKPKSGAWQSWQLLKWSSFEGVRLSKTRDFKPRGTNGPNRVGRETDSIKQKQGRTVILDKNHENQQQKKAVEVGEGGVEFKRN